MRHLLTTILPEDFKNGENTLFVRVLAVFGYRPEQGFR
jgi:hypothetical protein